MSHPAGVRGLKFNAFMSTLATVTSHPAGVRGLKLFNLMMIIIISIVVITLKAICILSIINFVV